MSGEHDSDEEVERLAEAERLADPFLHAQLCRLHRGFIAALGSRASLRTLKSPSGSGLAYTCVATKIAIASISQLMRCGSG